MEDKNLAIQPVVTQSDKQKKVLRELILKKRKVLLRHITKNEMLRVEIDMVRQEYDMRVGKLILRSNQQDLDIIFYNNLLELLRDGYSYDDAIKKLDETYYGEQRKIEEEKEKLKFEREIFQKRAESDAKNNPDIKQLWKFLVSKFHPDLVQDASEKARREELMKKVNQAYEEGNYNILTQLKNDVHVENAEESTIQNLEEILVEVENEIITQEIMYKQLKESYWYSWKLKLKKAKKDGLDIFIDLERPLLNDIVRNDEIIAKLKQEIEEFKK